MDEIGRKIKARLAMLDLTQRELIPELSKRLGRDIAASELSNAITGAAGVSPRTVKLRMAVDRVLFELEEAERNGNDAGTHE